jgi:tetratricopeptide (TPR) repeat protein
MGDRHGVGQALNNLGLGLREVRRFEEAITAHTRAVDIYQEMGDLHGEGTAWNNLGIVLQEVRRFEEAIIAHTQARDISRNIGDRRGEGTASGGLGMALEEVDRRVEARDVWQHAVAAFAESGDERFAERVRGWLEGLDDPVPHQNLAGCVDPLFDQPPRFTAPYRMGLEYSIGCLTWGR